jgi:hypothetical protein
MPRPRYTVLGGLEVSGGPFAHQSSAATVRDEWSGKERRVRVGDDLGDGTLVNDIRMGAHGVEVEVVPQLGDLVVLGRGVRKAESFLATRPWTDTEAAMFLVDLDTELGDIARRRMMAGEDPYGEEYKIAEKQAMSDFREATGRDWFLMQERRRLARFLSGDKASSFHPSPTATEAENDAMLEALRREDAEGTGQ